jgi:transcriptional regulator with XRE-family HTH domain
VADSAIGTSLRAARERLGWSREALAYHSGISWSAIAQIESGRRANVRLSSLSALASALGVTTDYLGGNAAAGSPAMFQHRVLVYRSDEELLDAVIPFLREGLERSEAILVVRTSSSIKRIRKELADDAKRVEFADAVPWYSSPAEALRRYRSFIDARLTDGFNWIRIVGEPVWADRPAAEVREWTRYESVINLTLAAAPVTIMCPYDARSTPERVMHDAACTHPECAQPDGAVASGSYCEPEQFLIEHR